MLSFAANHNHAEKHCDLPQEEAGSRWRFKQEVEKIGHLNFL